MGVPGASGRWPLAWPACTRTACWPLAVTRIAGPDALRVQYGGGGVFDATGNFFNGQIDEVAVFDKALTSEQICSLLLEGNRQTCEPFDRLAAISC